MFRSLFIIILCLMVHCPLWAQDLTIKENNESVTLSNPLIEFKFNKSNADLTEIQFNQKSLLNGKDQRGYLLGPGFSMFPCSYRLVRKETGLIEIAFLHQASNHFRYELHYILQEKTSGIYCYLVQSHANGDSTGDYGQTRWGIRSDESLFDYHLVRDSIQGPMPKMADLRSENSIQDWTFQLPDGTVYTKYNYADYIDGRHVHGMAGQSSGLGMFVIQASHEYLNGGPTKQFQNVHSNPYLINMFNCGHFLSDIRKGDNKINDEWKKISGPFLLYCNSGNNVESIWKDAKAKASEEIKQWPYQWMREEGYDLARGSLKGKLQIDGKPAANATLVLSVPGFDWQAQSRDYIYTGHTNEKGDFEIKNIRAGNYTLYAYGCNSMDEFKLDHISIQKQMVQQMGILDWKNSHHGKTIWQIGIADRRTDGFTFSNVKRSYGLFTQCPADLNFTPGVDAEKDHWYYAQTKRGSWNILFDCPDASKSMDAYMTIAIAGAAKNPLLEVWVNDQKIDAKSFGNDASIYRSAVAGGYYQKWMLSFKATLLKDKGNIISLKLPNVKDGGGIMYDAIKLELQ